MAQIETDRIDGQRAALGPEGLATKGAELADAMVRNNVLPPEDMLRQVPIPSPDHIHFHSLTKFTTESVNAPPGLSLGQLPCFAEWYNVHSNFVYVSRASLSATQTLPRIVVY